MIPLIFFLAFSAFLVVAAWRDLATMTIPNWISIGLVAIFPVAAWSAGLSTADIGLSMAFAAGVLLVCMLMFYLSVFGGGDAKLLAAASLWTGLPATGHFIVYMSIAGGGLALVLILLRRSGLRAAGHAWAERLLSAKEGAPYAVAIAIGALAAAPLSPVLAPGLQLLGG